MIRPSFAATLAATLFSCSSLMAQDAPPPPPAAPPAPKVKQEEIIIRKKGKDAEKMTIVVDGDKVTINGKPMNEFSDGNVTIITKDGRLSGDRPTVGKFKGTFDLNDGDLEQMDVTPMGINKAMLGVVTTKTDDGVRITEVTRESGADKAGLKKEDIITKVGDTKVSDPNDLTEAIGKYNPNDKVTITYKRGGKEAKATATLTENKGKRMVMRLNGNDMNLGLDDAFQGLENLSFDFARKPKLGMQVQDVEEGKGVKVQDVDDNSPSAKAGLKEGDIVTQLNGKDINSVDEIRTATKELKEGDNIKVTFLRDGKSQTVDLKIPKKLKTADL